MRNNEFERSMVRRYVDGDFDQIQEWLKRRQMKVFHPNILPKAGFIVDEVAAMFLYETDSDICYLENLVSNPYINSEARDHAISLIVEAAFAYAVMQGFKFVMSITDHPQVIKRAIRSGAKVEPGKVLLTKQLK